MKVLLQLMQQLMQHMMNKMADEAWMDAQQALVVNLEVAINSLRDVQLDGYSLNVEHNYDGHFDQIVGESF